MLQEKLNYLLDKYADGEVPAATIVAEGAAVEIEGKTYPTLSHRFERRFIELRSLMHDGTLEDVSVFRFGRMEARGSDLTAAVMRELDLCRYISGCEISSITAFVREGRAANIIAKLCCGIVCTLEVSTLLPEGAEPVDKHEITARRGTACDRVVDTQAPQHSIYVFADKKETYQDVDFECYGLPAEQVAAVRAAFALSRDASLREDFTAHETTLAALQAAYEKTAISGEKVVL